MFIRHALRLTVCWLALALPNAWAAQFEVMGDYLIHYNALGTEVLQPEVARQYDVVRSKNRALLNISVRKKGSEESIQDKAVAAEVEATATNLTGQLKQIKMREIHEDEAIYYIGVFPINNEETLDFTLKVDPEKSGKSHEIKFRQQFFVD